MSKATAAAIGCAAAIITWFVVMLVYNSLGVATGVIRMCPQAPDWWISLYVQIYRFVYFVIAPGFSLFAAVWLFHRCRRGHGAPANGSSGGQK
jgi:hypothetical protein